MGKGKTVAITGKGGTGKSIIASLMVTMLAKRYPGEVLAIDADSAMSLPYTHPGGSEKDHHRHAPFNCGL